MPHGDAQHGQCSNRHRNLRQCRKQRAQGGKWPCIHSAGHSATLGLKLPARPHGCPRGYQRNPARTRARRLRTGLLSSSSGSGRVAQKNGLPATLPRAPCPPRTIGLRRLHGGNGRTARTEKARCRRPFARIQSTPATGAPPLCGRNPRRQARVGRQHLGWVARTGGLGQSTRGARPGPHRPRAKGERAPHRPEPREAKLALQRSPWRLPARKSISHEDGAARCGGHSRRASLPPTPRHRGELRSRLPHPPPSQPPCSDGKAFLRNCPWKRP